MGKSILDKLKERYEADQNRLKNPDLINTSTQTNTTAKQKRPIIDQIKNISLVDWAALATILATIIAIWIYVLQPLFSS
jgi:hypothetical protein